MKKFFLSVIFIGIGCGLWWMVTTSHRFSVKKWDSTFETTIRHSLNMMGFKNENIVSSLNVIRKDGQGEWVAKKLTLSSVDPAHIQNLKKDLEASGANVTESIQDGLSTLRVARGKRLYQEISFQK